MKIKANNTIDFAPNVNWMSAKASSYIPRNVSEVGRRIIALHLLRTDDGFRHIFRQCDDRWVVALTVGKRTAHTTFYDYAAFLDKQSFRGSSSITPDQSSVLVVDRAMNIQFIPKEDEVEATSTGGIVYASRCLTDFEMGLHEAIGRTTIDLVYGQSSEGKLLTFDDAQIDHLVMRLMQLKGRRWTTSLENAVEDFVQSDRLNRF